MTTNVYYRNQNGSLGMTQAMTNDAELAREAVIERLADEWRAPPHPVFSVVSKAREGWDG